MKKLFLLIALISLSTLSACSQQSNDEVKNDNLHKQTASLITISPEQSYTVTRKYLGQIKAKQHTNLSFEYPGKIIRLLVDNGDSVTQGQLLAELDTQLLSFKMAELQAQVSQAQAQIKLNQANLTRIKSLSDNGYSSKQRLDELNAENIILTSQINGLSARLDTLNYQIDQANLIAPFDGVISKRLVSNGEMASTGKGVFRILEQNNSEVSVGVPSKLAASLLMGQPLNIELNNSNKQQSAKIIAIGQEINPVNRTIQIRLKLIDNSNETTSFNGQLVRVAIEQVIAKKGYWLPLNAITDGVRGQWQIFLAKRNTSTDSYLLQAATVNILHATKDSVYINGLALEPHNIVAQGVHRYVSGQVIEASAHIKIANNLGTK